MVDTNELRGIIAKKGKTQTDVAKMLNITPKTFSCQGQIDSVHEQVGRCVCMEDRGGKSLHKCNCLTS